MTRQPALIEQIRSSGSAGALREGLAKLPRYQARIDWETEIQLLTSERQRVEDQRILTQANIAAAASGELTRRLEINMMVEFLGKCTGAGPEGGGDTETDAPAGAEAGQTGIADKGLIEACTHAFDAAIANDSSDSFYRYLVQRVTPAALLLFLLAILSTGYRYNLRLAGFYHARADALELMEQALAEDKFEALANALAADKLDFRSGKTPVDQVTELAKAVIGRSKK